jgi:hypothetical protein
MNGVTAVANARDVRDFAFHTPSPATGRWGTSTDEWILACMRRVSHPVDSADLGVQLSIGRYTSDAYLHDLATVPCDTNFFVEL